MMRFVGCPFARMLRSIRKMDEQGKCQDGVGTLPFSQPDDPKKATRPLSIRAVVLVHE